MDIGRRTRDNSPNGNTCTKVLLCWAKKKRKEYTE